MGLILDFYLKKLELLYLSKTDSMSFVIQAESIARLICHLYYNQLSGISFWLFIPISDNKQFILYKWKFLNN